MIGQFVSRFVGGIKVWQLLLALLIIPSIPIALWFSVLFGIFEQGIQITAVINYLMIFVGVIFVINSLVSLIRLYTENLELTVGRLGKFRYISIHWILLFSLILLYRYTPLEIEWIGLVVICLYAVIVRYIFIHQKNLLETLSK